MDPCIFLLDARSPRGIVARTTFSFSSFLRFTAPNILQKWLPMKLNKLFALSRLQYRSRLTFAISTLELTHVIFRAMPRNVEIKARLQNPTKSSEVAKDLSGKDGKNHDSSKILRYTHALNQCMLLSVIGTLLVQEDTFFNVPQGRLKVKKCFHIFLCNFAVGSFVKKAIPRQN